MGTVVIGSNSYFSYSDVANADIYLDASSNADAWRASDDDIKGRALVSGTRILDRLLWKGEKTDIDQPNAWPRKNTGITGLDDDETPQAIVDADCELATSIVDGNDWTNQQTTANGTQSLKAGSVEIVYFRGAEGTALPLPLAVWQLIAPYLAGGSTLTDAQSTGTEMCNPLERSLGVWMG